jgi:hypothetical protein
MKGMDNSREYLQGAYDAASWVQGVLISWGEVKARLALDELMSNMLQAMEDSFMQACDAKWPEEEPRPDDFTLTPREI